MGPGHRKFYVVDDAWDEETHGTPKRTGAVMGRPASSADEACLGENGTMGGINFSLGQRLPAGHMVCIHHSTMDKDWKFDTTTLLNIKGYNVTVLNVICSEMVVSLTWILKGNV